MLQLSSRLVKRILLSVIVAFGMIGTVFAAETPVRGGMLNYVVGSKIPSYDGHKETTFGMIHPIRPFYSLLLRVNPDNPQSPTDIICDVCESYKLSSDGKDYIFKLKQNVKFHDGTPMTSADIKATLDKIIFPPKSIPSSRKQWYSVVSAVEAPGKYELVVKMKRPLAAMVGALASPFNFIYSKKDLDAHGYRWHQKNINGTGAFKLIQHQPGAFMEGGRFKDFHVKGQPYLDGFKAISAPKMSVRLQAIRGNRAAIEFRGFPPKARDDLVRALGKKIRVQESDWNIVMGFNANQKVKRFKDPRVRQALSYSMDRWGGSKYLSKIALVKTVGGLVFPKHPLAAKKKWLQDNIPGFHPDVKANRAKAAKLLAEAGYGPKNPLKVTLWNRAVDQPYKVVGTWYIDQWRKTGIDADQKVVPSGPWYAGLRKTKDFDVCTSFISASIVNPTIDVSKWLLNAGANYAYHEDKKTDDLYYDMLYEADAKKQYTKMRAYEKHVIGSESHFAAVMWWNKINPHRAYVKGWNIAPSHYLNQALDRVWIDPKLR